MTQNSLNILELLQVSPNKAIAGHLGMLESIGHTDAPQGDNANASFDMIFGNMLAGLSPELTGLNTVGAQNQQEAEPQFLNLLTADVADLDLDNLLVNAPVITKDAELIDENSIAFNKELEGLNSKDVSLRNINIKEILAQQHIELEDGTFKVLSKEISDSKLSLTIENANGKQITVSLPIDSIQQTNNQFNQERIQIQDAQYNKKLESLIEKVNIQEIEVKSIQNTEVKTSHTSLKPVEISIVGEQSAATVTLKASLKKNQIKIAEPNATNQMPKAAVLDKSGVFDEPTQVKVNPTNKLIENVSLKNAEQSGMSTQKVTTQSVAHNSNMNQPIEHIDSIFHSYATETADKAELKENIQQVRMQLPENIKSVLRPNNQALVIKMNPENLGPAKLSLSFSGGKLRAKLVVSSLNAKQTIDGSMDRLVDQLHKAQIAVDKIDITVDENADKNQQFNRQQQWQRKMSHKNIDIEQFQNNEFEQSVRQPMTSATAVMSSGTVNYLA